MAAVTRYQPQTSLNRLPDLVDRLFRDSLVAPSFWDNTLRGGMSRPTLPVNLIEFPDSFVMHAALPGVNAENLDIRVVGREVTITGKIEMHLPEKAQWVWQGIPSGEFYESYTLPLDVDGNQIEANYTNGILTLTLPKAAHVRPKNIQIQVNK